MALNTIKVPEGVHITKAVPTEFAGILSEGALEFVRDLSREFCDRREKLLKHREERQKDIDKGNLPSFLPETEHIRKGRWKVARIPDDLKDRRVEITGPVDRKMMINALNSGAKVFMADFEDAHSPSWTNTIQGQINLRDAINRTIEYTNPANGKHYKLNEEVATLVVRVRGLHLEEKHVLVDGTPISGGLFDFGLYFYHNAKKLLANGSGPYFYLPKIESYLEARLWNDIFRKAQETIGIPEGSIRATVLIETILAAFEMDEILYELRKHAAGLNCGRWDYIFSYLKRLRNVPDVILPDRAAVTMTTPFMRAYSLLTIKTCHRRNVHAIGGMAAQIPIRGDHEANEQAFAKVRADKEREVCDGHDGTWVAHPDLVPVALEIFNQLMPEPNQIDKQLDEVEIKAEQLLEVPEGTITEEGLRTNVRVGIQYLEAWLRGYGAVPIYHLMEDAATAEISRAQIWQWIRHEKGVLNDGRKVTFELYESIRDEELQKIQQFIGEERYLASKFDLAARLFTDLTRKDEFEEFLTILGYRHL
ncbi:malate synthase A [Halalkalibacterium ligniniphilum]|uniref:malate synthase A n=1 Tax=Halalkalibacterium ligniniphilum TaxID=1134413 RepID=UPI0003470C91|nr:malate synthase A [Halalkalibacterium ligniniphilum]